MENTNWKVHIEIQVSYNFKYAALKTLQQNLDFKM
jgi:hypothetical protein